MRMVLVRYRYADSSLRLRHRAAHLARLEELAGRAVLVAAGPEDDGGGAVVVLAVPDADAARALMDADPYVRAGAVAAYSTDPFDAVVVSPALVRDVPPERTRSIT